MATVTTRQGDTWDILAYRIYGSELYTDQLIKANYDYRNIVIFGAGVELTAPDIDTELSKIEDNLPPWKQEG